MKRFLSTWGLLIVSVLLESASSVVLKHGVDGYVSMNNGRLSEAINIFRYILDTPWLIMGIITFLGGPWFFAIALSRMEISVAYPAQVGLNLLVLTAAAVVFLGEPFDLRHGSAVLFITIGCVLLYE